MDTSKVELLVRELPSGYRTRKVTPRAGHRRGPSAWQILNPEDKPVGEIMTGTNDTVFIAQRDGNLVGHIRRVLVELGITMEVNSNGISPTTDDFYKTYKRS